MKGEGRDVEAWLADAVADVERRGLPELKPLLEALAPSTTALRAADWNRGEVVETQNEETPKAKPERARADADTPR
jgi:hypothetical protein